WRSCRAQWMRRSNSPLSQGVMEMQIGIIGLGRMGGNISRRLMKAGHHCVVFDTNAKPREALAEAGAASAGSIAELTKMLTDKPRAVGQPVVVNPDAELRRIAVDEGWEVLHLDRLGQRLKVLAALGAVAALGGLGRAVRAPRSGARATRGSARWPARIG
ncbi:MAG TPA: NAD(P)-binding domain-containing protein, partial [Kofleriaceae bacterium]|nr:NAD(P)-binding domain-containing protein [Kofleriaceae bacterium]